MKLFTTITTAILTVPALFGQMTLNDCLIYASEHSHDIIISRLNVSKAEADKRITVADMLPYLSMSSSGNLSFGRNIDPETNTYDNKQTLSTGFGLNLSLPLFDGLVRFNNLKVAEMARRRRLSDVEIERDRISFDVIKAFYNVAYCKAMVEQMEMQLHRDSLDLAATVHAERLGTKSGADVAQMEALVATDRFELANQNGLLAKSYYTLKGSMGMPPDSAPVDLIFDAPEFNTDPTAVNPRVEEARQALRQSEYELRAARGAFSPKISLNGGISTSYYRMFGSGAYSAGSFSRQWHNNMGEYIGFSVSIPLFTGFATTNRLKRAKINLEESRVKLEKTRYEVARETSEAELDLRTATIELEAAEKRLEAEQVAYDAVHRRYELGSASVIDLYTSGAQLATAKAAVEGKRIQRIISDITLKYYNGAKLINRWTEK
ncbi:MAG: TolC family protein [Muribaculaceae bacterium]|nr:TolC family protein [Muribaculaceae bacterium]